MSNTAQQVPSMTLSEVRVASVSFIDKLDDGELLTGTPVVDAVTGFTFENVAVNTAALTINGKSVAIGQAVQFKVTRTTAVVADSPFTIPVSCGTDRSPAQTLRGKLLLALESDA